MEQVIQQYQATVRPMHNLFVEPGKQMADLIVHASHHGKETLDISCTVLTHHLRAVMAEHSTPRPSDKSHGNVGLTTRNESNGG
jgi:uridine kinase